MELSTAIHFSRSCCVVVSSATRHDSPHDLDFNRRCLQHYRVVCHEVLTGSGGILKLHEDVQTCGYKDVQVMFEMLTSELEASHAARKPPLSPPHKRPAEPKLPPLWSGRSSSSIAAAQ